MDDVIALGIDAKHSNEDVIAPFERWIELYGDRIGLLGGSTWTFSAGSDARRDRGAGGWSGAATTGARRVATRWARATPSPIMCPVEGYLAMLDGARLIREGEACI